jgi:hypothetical protein
MDRIEEIYNAIDEIVKSHGKPRPAAYGGGKWDFDEEIRVWIKQVTEGEAQIAFNDPSFKPLTNLQWGLIRKYIVLKRAEVY